MAVVPFSPQVSVPQSAAPTPGLSVQPPAGAFSGNVLGAGLAETAKAAGQTSDQTFAYAQQVQALANKQASDTHGLAAAQAVGQMAAAFRENNTQDQAVANYPKFLTDIEAKRQEFGAGLSPLAKTDFDSLSRRFIFSDISQTSNYVAQQGHAAIIKKADASAQVAGQLFATNPTPENEAAFLQQAGSSAQQFFAGAGLKPDDPQVKQKLLEYTSPAYSTLVETKYAQGDLAGANAALTQHATDLTPQAYEHLSLSLRVANKANDVHNEADALLHGGEVGTAAEGSRAARNNNPLNLTVPGNGGTYPGQIGTDERFAKFDTPASGMAAADATLQAYGTKHGINTLSGVINRWAPPSENDTASYINTVAKATGIDPAAPINLQDPGVRKEILTAMAKVEGGGTGGGAVKFDPIPLPKPGEDPNVWIANTELEIHNRAQAAYPNDAAERDQVEQTALAQAHREVAPIMAQQKANYDTIYNYIEANNVQDPAAVDAKFPGQVASLSPAYQGALHGALNYNSRVLTPERSQNIDTLNGLYANAKNDPASFLKADVRGMDLPLGMQQDFLKKQAEIKDGKGLGGPAQVSVNRAFALPQVAAALKALDFPTTAQGGIDRQDPKALQFSGMLYADLNEWAQENPGKKLDDSTIISHAAALTARVGAKPGGFLGLGSSPGTAPAELTPAETDAATARLTAQLHRPPAPFEVGQYIQTVRDWKARNGR